MALSMQSDRFFCIGNVSACSGRLDMNISYTYADGETKSISPLSLVMDSKAGSAPVQLETVRFYKDVFWISCKDTRSGRAIEKITIELTSSEGTVEQLGLKYGTGGIDPTSRSLMSAWEQQYLRHDIIQINISGKQCEIDLAMKKSEVLTDLAEEKSPKKADITVSDEDMLFIIKTDKNVLSYYTGDDKNRADELLENALTAVESGQLAEALSAIEEAEKIIVNCLDRSMADTVRYRNDL